VQRKAIEQWVEVQLAGDKKGAQYLGCICDPGVSAKIPLLERPQGQAILATIGAGDCLVVSRHDRAFRSGADVERTVELFNKIGVRLVMLNLNIDTTTAEGMFLATMFGAVSRWEREMIGKRTREALALKWATEKKGTGIAVFGWKLVGDKGKKESIPNEHERELAMYLLNGILDGVPVLQLIRDTDAIWEERFSGVTKHRRHKRKTRLDETLIRRYALYAALGFPNKKIFELVAEYGKGLFTQANIRRQWEIRNGKPLTE
jgi:DNA invertase Pin-like site-specific DNA recombinase